MKDTNYIQHPKIIRKLQLNIRFYRVCIVPLDKFLNLVTTYL